MSPAMIFARQTASAAPVAQSSTDPVDEMNARPAEFIPIVVIGLVILATVAGLFAYRAWKGRRMASESRVDRHQKALDAWYQGSDEADIEKPKKAALAGDVEAYAGWTPQIHTWKGIHVQGMQLPSESNVGKALAGKVEKKKVPPMDLTLSSPPPTYMVALPDAATKPSVPPVSNLRVPPPAVPVNANDKPIASPKRTSSRFATQQIENQNNNNPFVERQSSATKNDDDLPLPRVMIVQNTFTPSLEDELSVVRGEAIRMLAEYKDGWAVCQRVGAVDSPKGVVPRSCLQERQEINLGRRI